MKLSREEFERLSLEHLDMLYRIARRLTRGDAPAAEDLVQETYLRAFRAQETFDLHQEYGIKPWLLRIMHNLHFSRSGREKRQPASIDDDQLAAMAEKGAGLSSSAANLPLSAGSFEGMDEQLVRAMNDLPANYQKVVML